MLMGDVSTTLTESTTSVVPTKSQRLRSRIQFASLCWTLYVTGWNDGSSGPLLPRIQKVYNVGFTTVSLIFVFACIGFLIGATTNVILTDKLGFGKVIVIGAALQVIAYSLEASAPPFPVFILGYGINGMGMAYENAQSVGYVASFKKNAEAKMGLLMAAYGAGAFSSPLVATHFSQLPHWSFHYLCSLGIALSNTIILTLVFGLKNQDECLAQIGLAAMETGTSQDSKFRQIFALRDVHLLASFILVYVGAEVTVGGWIVTYVIDVRGGGPSSGYISSGFFGGLMIGRVALLWVNRKVGERRVMYIYAVVAIGLEFVVWFVPSLVGGAVSVAIIGVFLGPMYPIAMNQAGRILPRWLLTGCIGWIAGFGQAGSAILPFMTGSIASRAGITSLQPLLVAMMGLMTILWALVPRNPRKVD
ncbi:hypothetical protein SERLA73DRAFT_172543 [Serpula lacrymans var. lacrymans S7.3]|uniref:Major facilitator superfamily (MFS) profile domain-containing protein n=2 Tax=Serpula lacrymans var. lacrymans TaxID=341189 RepID=F8QFN8_SERL3|nr:uncharacterized protein SERLADRAFT_445492 [Serpula lacrymans var. lacrymans S7.9]EGN92872.1 hypothetical protein SERLA73DRAFT_172543 [Serpula lacrymans var. lacrymans S7.3]EGO29705.1 hypothetical protein SERLADRAFT_445492 [Serpula lacrymans var. lacrymans S7.9]